MNTNLRPDGTSDVPWPTSDHRMPVPGTSMLPGSEIAPPAGVNLLKNAVQGAHDTIDRMADKAAPVVRQIGDSVAAAGDALHVKTDALRETGDAWVEGARSSVRDNPLLALAAAVALGAVLARVLRTSR